MRRLALALFVLVAGLSAEAGTLVLREGGAPTVAYQNREGEDRRPADLGGKLTLVHLWASWCGTCRTEFPALQTLQEDMRAEGLRVAAISIDRLGWPAIDRTTESLGIRTLAVFHDRNRDFAQALGVTGLPTTVVLDSAGREIGRIVGAGDWASAELRTELRRLMTR